MGAAHTLFVSFEPITCCAAGCGVTFAVPDWMLTKLRQNRNSFYCPNGHGQSFTGETEEQKLRRELEKVKKKAEEDLARVERQKKWAEESRDLACKARDRQERRAAAFKGHLARTHKRVGNGVCPCCKRTFAALARHMACKHPGYKKSRID